MTPDPTLAGLSDTFFTITVALYSLAVVAFCAQLAFGRPAIAASLWSSGLAHRPAWITEGPL